MNNRQECIDYIKKFYKTLRGKPVESCSTEQLLAVYYSLQERKKQTLINKEKPMKPIIIYTDGACRNNQKDENLGAYAYKLIYGDKIKTFAKVIPNTTNNKMELQAVIAALKAIKPTCRHYNVYLYTDSMYVVKGYTEWLNTWKKNNYNKIKNPELWKELDNLSTNFTNLKMEHIPGHADFEEQEEVDRLCNQALDNYKEFQE